MIISANVPCKLKKRDVQLFTKQSVPMSHMSGALDGREKIKGQKLGHPILLQPILSQKM